MAPLKKSQQIITVNETEIRYVIVNGEKYISLTDMARNYGSERAIESWIRNKNTIEFLGTWEVLNNRDFNSHEFVGIKNEAGLNRFNTSVKEWVGATNAIGVIAKTGRYGGSYAHYDIAFEFASQLSPEFKLYLIKEFQRLKAIEAHYEQWDIRRFLSKAAYKIQTQAIYNVLQDNDGGIPALQKKLLYASEADLLNVLVFGQTASEWKKANPDLAKNGNQRDHATVKQLLIVTHLESINANMITRKIDKKERIRILADEAQRQQAAIDALKSEEDVQKFKNSSQGRLPKQLGQH